MTVGVQVGSIADEIGAASFLNAFFSTVTAVLEHGERGRRFPVIAGQFYAGEVPASGARAALRELQVIRAELADHPVTAVVWDLDDRAARPPWGDDISPQIRGLADYFVSSTGRDLFELLTEAFEAAVEENQDATIVAF